MCKLILAGIVNDSITDGSGLRLALFAQGCPKRCEGCHNPQAQPFEGGTEYGIDEIMEIIKRNPLLSGVTFTGGEPFSQAAAFAVIAEKVKETGLNVCVYTGYTFEKLVDMLETPPEYKKLLENTDILIDGEFVQSMRNLDLKFKGSENQRVIDVPASLAAGYTILCSDSRWV